MKAQTLNKFIDTVEFKKNKPEVLIKDLVSSFLIPDVERKQVQKQRKYHHRVNMHSAIRREEVPRGRSQDYRPGGGGDGAEVARRAVRQHEQERMS